MATPTERPLTTGRPAMTGSERSLGQLVSDAMQDLSGIFKSEIELAKTEIKQDVSHMGKGAGMLAGAGVLGLFFLGFLLTGIVYLLERFTPLPLWACWLIVAALLALLAGILAMIGLGALKKAKGKPEKTIEHGQKTVAAVKGGQAEGKARVETLKYRVEEEKAAKERAKEAEKAREDAAREAEKARKQAEKDAAQAEKDLEKARREAEKLDDDATVVLRTQDTAGDPAGGATRV